MNNRTITYRDRRNAARLKRIWNRKKETLDLTQTKLADQWGIRQSAISQYLSGAIALNTDAVFKFAKALKISPLEIDPSLLEEVLGTGNNMAWIAATNFTPEPGTEYYIINAETRRQHVAAWDKSRGYVDIHTDQPIDALAVIPTLQLPE